MTSGGKPVQTRKDYADREGFGIDLGPMTCSLPAAWMPKGGLARADRLDARSRDEGRATSERSTYSEAGRHLL